MIKYKNDNLHTPTWIWRSLGIIDLDPCAAISITIGVHNYRIDAGKNGLELPWHGFVFCNPPFSQKQLWIDKMVSHGLGILLLPERGSAPWFGSLAQNAGNYFVMGKKINFIGGLSSNNVGSCLFLFGDEAKNRILASGLPGHLVSVINYTERKQELLKEAVNEQQKRGFINQDS